MGRNESMILLAWFQVVYYCSLRRQNQSLEVTLLLLQPGVDALVLSSYEISVSRVRAGGGEAERL